MKIPMNYMSTEGLKKSLFVAVAQDNKPLVEEITQILKDRNEKIPDYGKQKVTIG